ncbi:MAG: lipoate--protein ligase family protein [bacterium]
MKLDIIPFKKFSGKYNMEYDLFLFNNFEEGTVSPTLRIYGWKTPCISLGHAQDPEKELNIANCRKNGIEIVKRPTGGGIVFHNEHEVTYSLICGKDETKLPEGLVGSYKFISNIVIKALRKFGLNAELSDTRHSEQARLCFSFPASYEITLEGSKIVGSAQKRGKKALLQQGSIFVRNSDLKPADFIKNCIDFKAIYDISGTEIDQNSLSNALSAEFAGILGRDK